MMDEGNGRGYRARMNRLDNELAAAHWTVPAALMMLAVSPWIYAIGYLAALLSPRHYGL